MDARRKEKRRKKEMTGIEDWHLLLQVFSRLDGRSLARAACACKIWSAVALQEDLWKQICRAKWPSLDSNAGHAVLKQAGGYRQFFARRFQAPRARSAEAEPSISLQDLIFLVDVAAGDDVACSFIRCGVELGDGGDETFRFTVGLGEREVKGTGAGVSDVEAAKELRVSWAAMLAGGGGGRVFQVMESGKHGQVVGDTCTFSEGLRDLGCCPPGLSEHVAEMALRFGVTGLTEVQLSFMNTMTWRYFSRKEALRYFQHAFSEDWET